MVMAPIKDLKPDDSKLNAWKSRSGNGLGIICPHIVERFVYRLPIEIVRVPDLIWGNVYREPAVL